MLDVGFVAILEVYTLPWGLINAENIGRYPIGTKKIYKKKIAAVND